MNVRGSGGILAQALKDLSFEWDETKGSWRDLKAVEFERKYLEQLPGPIARAIAAIEEVEVLLRRIRHDCE
jgi:hypothetical protein